MKVVSIVQARMGSSRLSGKVMKEILGKPVLWHIVDRIKRAKLVDQITIATTNNPGDKIIVDFAKENTIDCYAGSENDIVDRLYQAAKRLKADAIVRITADCPLVDPAIVDKVIKHYLDGQGKFDYVSNINPPTYPDGLDTEIYSLKAFEKVWKEVESSPLILDSLPAFFQQVGRFCTANMKYKEDLSHMRWTLDYQGDLDFITEIYKRLYQPDRVFLMEDILNLLKNNPQLMNINAGHTRNEHDFKVLKTR